MESVLDIQTQAVLREYREALEDGSFALAGRIRAANPDLAKAFSQANDEWFEGQEDREATFLEADEVDEYLHYLAKEEDAQ